MSFPLTVVLLALMSGMVYLALGFNAEARRIPLVVGVPTVGLLVIQVIRELLALRASGVQPQGAGVRSADQEFGQAASMAAIAGAKGASEDPQGPSEGSSSEGRESSPKATTTQAFAWVLFLAFAFYLFGMLLAVPVFMGAFTRLYGREPWRVTILLVLGTVGVLHFFFVVLLGIRLYPGIVGPMIGL